MTAQQQAAATQTTAANATESEAKKLLDEILDNTGSPRSRALRSALDQCIGKIEELLPVTMRGQAKRLVKRAMFTFEKSPGLQACSASSFLRCVLAGAELGLAIDGKLAHAVPRKGQATFQPDYKGLIAVARRSGQIVDVVADVVCAKDSFTHGRQGGENHLDHTYQLGKDRGEVIGAYSIVYKPDGTWKYDLMDRKELDAIQDRSESKKDGHAVGPWVTDRNEMFKKTVIKRSLKLYCDDPGIQQALDADAELNPEPIPAHDLSAVTVRDMTEDGPAANGPQTQPAAGPVATTPKSKPVSLPQLERIGELIGKLQLTPAKVLAGLKDKFQVTGFNEDQMALALQALTEKQGVDLEGFLLKALDKKNGQVATATAAK